MSRSTVSENESCVWKKVIELIRRKSERNSVVRSSIYSRFAVRIRSIVITSSQSASMRNQDGSSHPGNDEFAVDTLRKSSNALLA